jgi:DNA-binding IclR family transcriptional regulator
VGVISKVLRILEVLQNSSVGLGLKAICDQTGINKSTAHRFLSKRPVSDVWTKCG